MRKMLLALPALVVVVGLSAVTRGDDWPQFRGPNGSGTSAETGLPDTWDSEKNVAWKAKLPGYAWSSPIIWADKAFLTTAVTDKQAKPSGLGFDPSGFGNTKPPDAVYTFEVHCLDLATGKALWSRTAAERKPAIASWKNVYAAETPVTDGERVYAYFGMHGLFCYDLAGKPLWQKDLGSYEMAAGFGTGSSPVLADGRLFVQCDNEEKSFLAALDKRTGTELWRADREEKSTWSTPLVWKNAARTELVLGGGKKVRSYDPATGKVLWEMAGEGDRRPFSQSAGTAVADAERLYFGTSGGGPLVAVKAGAAGDVTLKRGETSSAAVAWSRPRAAPHTVSPLLYRGHVYVLDAYLDTLSSYDAATGEQAYRERLGGRGSTSSPWAYGGKVFCLDQAGTTCVVAAGAAFELLGKNKLGEVCWSSPAAGGGALVLRTADHVYCVKAKGGEK